MHVRIGDFQYKHIRIPATEIYENIHDVFVENSTVFIATDERNKTFFEPLQKHYKVLFLDDFLHLIPDLNKNYYGMLDQRIASRGRTFTGAYLSTFTGYINRMRGYHSQKEKLPGYEMGILKSYFYAPKENKEDMTKYSPLRGPLWGREFPVAWRDIDHNLDREGLQKRHRSEFRQRRNPREISTRIRIEKESKRDVHQNPDSEGLQERHPPKSGQRKNETKKNHQSNPDDRERELKLLAERYQIKVYINSSSSDRETQQNPDRQKENPRGKTI